MNYRFEGEIRQALAGLNRAEEVLRQTLLIAESELSSLQVRRIAAAQRLDGFEKEILSRSQQVLDRAEAAYTRGATSLTDLLDARRTFRAVQLDSIQARLEAARAETEWRLRSNLIKP
jgi:cobalt-zinc-cadmium efflux system outer membrane protein